MNKAFSGKDLKALSKSNSTVVIRQREEYQTAEFSKGALSGGPVTSIECNPGYRTSVLSKGNFDCSNDWVISHINEQDTQWQFFVTALKPTDKVVFFEQDWGSVQTVELGLSVTYLMASIRGYKRGSSEALVYHRNCIIETRISSM